MASIEKIPAEIFKALKQLGYRIEKRTVTILNAGYQRYTVYLNENYFGIWDSRRKTFVD